MAPCLHKKQVYLQQERNGRACVSHITAFILHNSSGLFHVKKNQLNGCLNNCLLCYIAAQTSLLLWRLECTTTPQWKWSPLNRDKFLLDE